MLLYTRLSEGKNVIGVFPFEDDVHDESTTVVRIELEEEVAVFAQVLSGMDALTTADRSTGSNPIRQLLSKIALAAYKLGQADKTERIDDF